MSDKCNHKWVHTPEFSICEKCGEMTLSKRMQSLRGIIHDDNPLKRFAEDVKAQSVSRKLNDKYDGQ